MPSKRVSGLNPPNTKPMKYTSSVLWAFLLMATASPAWAQKNKAKAKPATAPSRFKNVDRAVDSLLKIMTLEEKIGQLNLLTSDLDVTGASLRPQYRQDIIAGKVGAVFNAYGVDFVRKLQEIAVKNTRLHIPLLFGYDVIHGHKTIFPMPLAMACSWDMGRIEGAQRIAATEAASMGLDWTFAPMVDIARDPRWGRVMEGAGEDPYLGSEIAKAQVRGFQGKGIYELDAVMACAKHYAAYGAAQAGRDYNTVDMSERVLRDIYLPPFKAANDAGCATYMTSFNELDGVPATASKHLLDDILRKEWGFKGFVVTDYTAIMETIFHGTAKDSAEAGMNAILAGNDMDMQSAIYVKFLPELVKSGKVPMKYIDESAGRILRKKFELGLFDDPYRRLDAAREKANILTPAFRQASRELAARSCVLLKNDNNALPIAATAKKVVLIGPLGDAAHDMIGGWSAAGYDTNTVSLYRGLYKNLKGASVQYVKGCDMDSKDRSGFAAAVEAAKGADAIILALGEPKEYSAEASSRAFITLPGVQADLLAEVKKAAGKPVVVVLFNGRPLDLSNVVDKADAVLEAWYPGTEAGNGVADVLTGAYNPSGKLTMTFPRTLGQVPIFYNHKMTGRPDNPKEKYTSKYLDVPNSPLYNFGHGLSYTSFQYGAPVLNRKEIGMSDSLKISVQVTNTGKRAGEEVVQLYVRDLVGSVTRPVQELKGFRKIMLAPGQAQTVVFSLTANDLRFYTKDMKFAAEPGDFQVMTGGASDQVQTAGFTLR